MDYPRPALVLDKVIDELTEGRFTAGFLSGQSRLMPLTERTQPFYQVMETRKDLRLFSDWMDRNERASRNIHGQP